MAFRKINLTEEADYLARSKKNAFILFYFIARRARHEDCPFEHMKAGWAYVGDYKNYGLTRKEYRTALQFLVDENYIEIIAKNHKVQKTGHLEDEKRAIERATNGTLVNILDNRVWDVISADQKEKNQKKGHQKGHLHEQKRATEGPPRGHKEEGDKESDKEVAFKRSDKKAMCSQLPPLPLSHAQSVTAFLEPENFRLADGKPLSLRTQNAFKRYEGKERIKLQANMMVYLEDAKIPGFSPKTTHEACLQGYIKNNIAGKRDSKRINSMYAAWYAAHNKIDFVKILKTVVQVGRYREGLISISLEQGDNEFEQAFLNAIEHQMQKV